MQTIKKLIKEFFQDSNGDGSSKRFIAIFITCVIVLANLIYLWMFIDSKLHGTTYITIPGYQSNLGYIPMSVKQFTDPLATSIIEMLDNILWVDFSLITGCLGITHLDRRAILNSQNDNS